MKQILDPALSMRGVGLAIVLTPSLTSNAQAKPAMNIEKIPSSSALTGELKTLERSFALSYFSPNPLIRNVKRPNSAMSNETMDAPKTGLPKEHMVKARVVSDEVAPFVWANDEPDVEDEILLPRPRTTPANVVVVSRERPPFIFHEDELECEDEILLPPPRRTPVEVEVVFKGRPPFVFRDEFEGEAL